MEHPLSAESLVGNSFFTHRYNGKVGHERNSASRGRGYDKIIVPDQQDIYPNWIQLNGIRYNCTPHSHNARLVCLNSALLVSQDTILKPKELDTMDLEAPVDYIRLIHIQSSPTIIPDKFRFYLTRLGYDSVAVSDEKVESSPFGQQMRERGKLQALLTQALSS